MQIIQCIEPLLLVGQSSGPQTISSWGGRGQTAPPQAAQPNHYQPQPHNSLQQTWNEFKPRYFTYITVLTRDKLTMFNSNKLKFV